MRTTISARWWTEWIHGRGIRDGESGTSRMPGFLLVRPNPTDHNTFARIIITDEENIAMVIWKYLSVVKIWGYVC